MTDGLGEVGAPERQERKRGRTVPDRGLGFFRPGSVVWDVHREQVLLLGGPRALLLQIAHPLVAAGVADHSDFRSDPLGRLRRTLEVTLGFVFGDRAHAEACAARLRAVHARVEGKLAEAAPAFRAGTRYRALDPDLLLWVHATLVDTTLLLYPRLVRPLSPAERRRYYAESKQLARFAGVPETRIPPDLRAFRRYVATMLRGSEIVPTATARAIADAVLRPPRPLWLWSLQGLSTLAAAALLPPRLREAYDLPFRGRERRAWRLLEATLRRTLPLLPARVRWFPEAREADARVARGPGASSA